VILAIDDDAGRYDGLRRLLDQRPGAPALVVACCSACVLAHLPRATAVLLDYDLDGQDPCAACDGATFADRHKAILYVPEIAAAGVPVVVTSASYSENVDAMIAKLRAYGVGRIARYSAHDTMPEPHWLAALWSWGVL
jgi:DNA-binding NarL/FixJ family response regulator